MNVEALGGNADLRRVEEGAEEDLLCNIVEIDIRHHDGRVIAAEFKCHALEVLGGAGEHGLSGSRRAGEGNLGTARMGRHPGAKLIAAADDVQHAGREDIPEEFTDLEGAERGERRRFQHHRVAGDEGRGDLPHGQRHGEVPRRDGADHAERHVLGLDPLRRRVLGHMRRRGHHRDGLQPLCGTEDLLLGRIDGAALFAGKQPCEVVGMCRQNLAGLAHQRLTFGDGHLSPDLESCFGRRNSFIELLLSAVGCRGEYSSGRGIHNLDAARRCDAVAVDRH